LSGHREVWIRDRQPQRYREFSVAIHPRKQDVWHDFAAQGRAAEMERPQTATKSTPTLSTGSQRLELVTMTGSSPGHVIGAPLKENQHVQVVRPFPSRFFMTSVVSSTHWHLLVDLLHGDEPCSRESLTCMTFLIPRLICWSLKFVLTGLLSQTHTTDPACVGALDYLFLYSFIHGVPGMLNVSRRTPNVKVLELSLQAHNLRGVLRHSPLPSVFHPVDVAYLAIGTI
jgi:hypothetical protein